MPSRWIADGQLCAFRGGGAGGQAAALKLYMALAMFAAFKPTPSAPIAGSARLSFSDLERQCDISRRYVSRGLEVLKERRLLTVDKVGNAHRYLLSGYEAAGWAKLPSAHLLRRTASRGSASAARST
jgi:DNA-binding transcriptional ArsR family regulator